jgi:phosphomannomutase
MADQIIEMYHQRKVSFVKALDCGKVNSNNEANQIHANKVLSIIEKTKIASKRFKIVLDSVNGAGGPEAIFLLEALGCEVIGMNTEPTGLFAHTPEPTAQNLTSLCKKVAECGADSGFAQDPDADRLAIVDEKGHYIGEEFTLAFAAKYVFSQMQGSAAANLSTSRMIDDIAVLAGCSVIRTPVGEANVANAMVENNCVIGGEGNGGIIDLRVGPIRDSLVGMALTLALLAKTGKTVSQLAAEVGGYTMHKIKYPADKQQAAAIIQKAKAVLKDAAINDSDGCRFDLLDGWIHIRTSNTEPIMRVIIEARSPEISRRYMEQIESVCRDVFNP